jgi:predicted dehydrogenase
VTAPVHLAVIGCGDVAMQRHLPAIEANPMVRLAAVCDTDLARAAVARERFGADFATDDASRVLADQAIDAVIIATPPWVTPELTIAALAQGKDVLAEKPMALDAAAAQRVLAAEARTDRFVQIGFVMRHGPMFGTLRQWIQEGALGSPLVLRIGIFDEVHDPVRQPEHYQRMLATLHHGAPCVHEGAHTMDHLHYLLGERAERIASWGATTRPEFPASNYNAAHIFFPGGHVARVEIGWLYPVLPAFEWTILGPLGVASFDLDHRRVSLRTAPRDESVGLADGEDWFESCFRIQLEAFVEGIRTRKPSGPSAQDGYASLMLCRAFAEGLAGDYALREVSYR